MKLVEQIAELQAEIREFRRDLHAYPELKFEEFRTSDRIAAQLAAWGKTQIDNALAAAGTNAHDVGLAKLAQVGVLYSGLETLGGGATLAGIILGAITVFIIDRELEKAAAFALAGMLLTFFGFIHGEGIGIGRSPEVATSYLGVAAILFLCAKYAAFHPHPAVEAPQAAD